MIKTFRHKGIEKFFRSGNKAGIQVKHAAKLRRQLARLDASITPKDMDILGWRFHALHGGLKGHWSVWVSGNWRLIFSFKGENTELVDYQDYH